VTTSLLERVAEFVSANPGCTLPEIARGVRSADAGVRDVLASAAFYASARDAYPADRAQAYRLASEAADGLGRAARRSQNDLIAAHVADGEWHTTQEIHQRCGFSRLNSRVAELRKRRGMLIECRHVDGASRGATAYEYRFTGFMEGFGPSESADTLVRDAVAPGGESADSDGPVAQHDSLVAALLTETPAGSSDTQLDLGEAA